MTSLDVLLAVAGLVVTVLVIAGMVLITPLGQVEVHAEGTDPQGSNLSGVGAPDVPTRTPS
jgi:hypothetical protein